MKKFITILLIMSVVAPFTMSTGCFAEEKITPTEAFQNLLLTEDENNSNSTCGFACKTKNSMVGVWEAIKGIPGTITATIASVGASAVFFRKIYEAYTSEILKLHNENTELFEKYNDLLSEKKDFLSENEKLSNEKKNFLKAAKANFDNFLNRFPSLFLTNITQRLDPLSLSLDRISKKVAEEKTHKEERKNQLLARTEELLKLQTLNSEAEKENQALAAEIQQLKNQLSAAEDTIKNQQEKFVRDLQIIKDNYDRRIQLIANTIK